MERVAAVGGGAVAAQVAVAAVYRFDTHPTFASSETLPALAPSAGTGYAKIVKSLFETPEYNPILPVESMHMSIIPSPELRVESEHMSIIPSPEFQSDEHKHKHEARIKERGYTVGLQSP